MLRRLFLATSVFLYSAVFSIVPAIAYDDEWDGMGRGGDPSFTMLLIGIGIAYGAHCILKELDRDYMLTALYGCIVFGVIYAISYNVFDYQMGWGWFITIFVGSIYIGKNNNIV